MFFQNVREFVPGSMMAFNEMSSVNMVEKTMVCAEIQAQSAIYDIIYLICLLLYNT